MRQLAEPVRARHDFHAARLDRRIGERHPRRDVTGRLQRKIGRVLMPAHIGTGTRVLRPDREMEQPDVGTDQILHGIQHLGGVHDLVDPGEEEMRLEIMAARHLLALRPLEGFEPVAPGARAFRREGIDGTDITVVFVLGDLLGGELAGHQCAVQPPSTNSNVPVTKEESSLARKSAARATSSGLPMRPIGWRCFQKARMASGSA